MGNRSASSINRRTVVKSLVASAAAMPFARGFAQDATPDSGEWSFTDDKGVTVTLPRRPERIAMDVNAAAPLWDFGLRPTALFGWNVNVDGSLTAAGGRIDPDGIPTIGDANEPIKVEDLVATEPDLVITLTWTPDDPIDYWSIDEDAQELVREVAPIVAISATGRADENTRRFAELAEALGADLASPELSRAQTEFEAAIENLQAVAEDHADLSVLYCSVSPDGAVIANPTDWADLNMYLELGLDITSPEAQPGDFWEEISSEQALKYPTDVIMISIRNGDAVLEEVRTFPTWSQHPAVAAGQIYGWNQDFIMSYQGMTEALNQLAGNLESSEKVTEG